MYAFVVPWKEKNLSISFPQTPILHKKREIFKNILH